MTFQRPIAPATSNDAMAVVGALLEQRTGQQIGASRIWRLDASLKPILRDLGMSSIDDLASALVTSRDPALSDTVVDALLNQETSFFRDTAVFEMIGDVLAGRRADAPNRRLRVWSSGCSTGQEPLSLAMLMHERKLHDEALVSDIVASDVSAGAITRARAGKYTQFEVQRGLSIHRMIAWFEGEGGPEWTAKRELVDRIAYRRHNLVTEVPPPGGFDVILCRNIMLYFDPVVRRQVFDKLASALRPGGVLVLGASETVIGQTDRFAPHEQWRGLYRTV